MTIRRFYTTPAQRFGFAVLLVSFLGLLGWSVEFLYDHGEHIEESGLSELPPGTLVAVDYGWFRHFGVTAGDQVYHNSKEYGEVTKVDAGDFAEGNRVIVFSREVADPPGIVLERAEQHLGLKYDLFRHNCEHYGTWCLRGEAESKQVQALMVDLLLLLWSLGFLVWVVAVKRYNRLLARQRNRGHF